MDHPDRSLPQGPRGEISTWTLTQSVILDHVILINFQDTKTKTVSEDLGVLQDDHLYLHLDLDLTLQVDSKVIFNRDNEKKLTVEEGQMGKRDSLGTP